MSKSFCWACKQPVNVGCRVINCDMCEGNVVTVDNHPDHDELRKKEVLKLRRLYTKAVRDAERAAEARRNLGPGSTRARVTTANARWASAAEQRDRIAAKIAEWGEIV